MNDVNLCEPYSINIYVKIPLKRGKGEVKTKVRTLD